MDSLDAYHFDLPDDPPDHDFVGSMDNINLLQGSRKRKKVQLKKVQVCLPITGDASRDISKGLTPPTDFWAWRKYGQKPIKGSPYPRGYYRCSSSKGCSARKQVERSRRDPSMLVVTYTADHNHETSGKSAATLSSLASSSSSKDHDLNEATLTGINNDDDMPDLSGSTNQTHFKEPHISASSKHHIDLPSFHSPTTSHNFPPIMSSISHSSCDHQHYTALEEDQQQQVVVTPAYNWGPLKEEECIAGEWQEDEYYYIIDEKKDNMSLCLTRCEEDDCFSELGMLPELASIFGNKREKENNNGEEKHTIFGSTSWSTSPCPFA